MGDIGIELAGRRFRLLGSRGPVVAAIEAALVESGADRIEGVPDLLIVGYPLLPTDPPIPAPAVGDVAAQMAATAESGRIVFVLSALAALPARRYPDYSIAMAAACAEMRTLAMRLAPNLLVNAVGAGLIGEVELPVAGDASMLGHVALGRPGAVADIVNAVLFLCDPANTYTTGQLLIVDGGWSAGYARNF